jgi:hypothetical protein
VSADGVDEKAPALNAAPSPSSSDEEKRARIDTHTHGAIRMTTLDEAMAELSREPSAEEQEQKDWVHSFVCGAAKRVHERFHEEPTAEPERAAWHFNRNAALDNECWAAREAYAERFGHPMPEHWANTVRILKQEHHTNPYPNNTVRKMALGN